MNGNCPKVLVLFRNDDLCAWSDPKHESELLSLFNEFKVPVTLGVVPKVRGWRLDENKAILKLLEQAQSEGHELAMHGLMHDHHEFEVLPVDELRWRLSEGQRLMKGWFDQPAKTFIPPDNAWKLELLTTLVDEGFGVLSSGPPFLPLSSLQIFVIDAIARFRFTPLKPLIHHLSSLPSDSPIPLVVYFHSWEVRTKAHRDRLQNILRTIAETPNVLATTFSNAIHQFPEALKVWTEWRKDPELVRRWNEAFAHKRFYRMRMLFRYWIEFSGRNLPILSLEKWLVEVYEAALKGDVTRMEQLISEGVQVKNLVEGLRWVELAGGSAIGRFKYSQPPKKMEDSFDAVSSQVLSSMFSNSAKTNPPRSLVYLSFDRNIVSEHAAMTSKFLAKRGWKVVLVHPCGANWNAAPDGVLQLQVGDKVNGAKGIWQAQREMARLIASWKPPVIYARQHWQGLLPPLVAKRLDIPYVAEFNGLRHRGILAKNSRSLKGRFIRQLERWCAQWSTAVVVPSLSLARRIAELLSNAEIHNLTSLHHELRIANHAIFVIPNGIDPEVFRPIPKEEARKRLGLPIDGLYVAYTGSLHHWQGIDVLLHAFALLLPKFPNCRLLIVGGQDEPNKDAYHQLAHALRITDYATFIPFVPYERSALYISAADVCVAPYSPSYREHGGGSPLKLYAYLSCARPVVLSDLGEFVDADLVSTTQSGLLVPPNNPEALAEAIVTLLADPKLREEMGRRGREAVLNGYTWEHNAMRVEAVLESVMSNK